MAVKDIIFANQKNRPFGLLLLCGPSVGGKGCALTA